MTLKVILITYLGIKMELNIAKDFLLSKDEANKILKTAYLKGYFPKCTDVQNGCDIFRYVPAQKIVEFHIKDPMFWVELRLDQVIDCQIDLIEKQKHHEKRKL